MLPQPRLQYLSPRCLQSGSSRCAKWHTDAANGLSEMLSWLASSPRPVLSLDRGRARAWMHPHLPTRSPTMVQSATGVEPNSPEMPGLRCEVRLCLPTP